MNARSVFFLLLMNFSSMACVEAGTGPVVYRSQDAPFMERLAAREVRRYIYVRSAVLPTLSTDWPTASRAAQTILVGSGALSAAGRIVPQAVRDSIRGLKEEEYLIRSFTTENKSFLLIAGGGPVGTLYGAYRCAEFLGVRFALEGDVIPDDPVVFTMPTVHIHGSPRFPVRGIQPFHDFPEGPDWWGTEEYKAIIGQLPKLGMNFIGLHTYPEGHPNAEPTVWIGRSQDHAADGDVRFSYPSSYHNTARGNWGYVAKPTSAFHAGASSLFDHDAYGAGPMRGFAPEPKTPEDFNRVFNATARMLQNAFTYARSIGVKTCVGTEVPLTIPALVKQRLRSSGIDSNDARAAREIYRGIFGRILAAYPIDYYWFWTSEGWTWSDASPEAVARVQEDLRVALAAADEMAAPFQIATCGWVLGPPSDRTLFDRLLPQSVTVSCINREIGRAPVDVTFARIAGRQKWAIPWLEDDPMLTTPQLWAGRMRRDAMDALAYGCNGLLGIHWRTRVLSPNVSALAHAAWEPSPQENDRATILSADGPLNGRWISVPHDSLVSSIKTAIPETYADIRDQVFGYRLPVPSGIYTVTLQFLEPEVRHKDNRVFDVLLQGRKVEEKLDIFARVGRFTPLELSYDSVRVTDGRLVLEFADRIHYPAIAGIIVHNDRFAKKINCGGPAAGVYDADWPATPRSLPVQDFYLDWAASQFGHDHAAEIGALFARIDGRLPAPATWTDGPGGVVPDRRSWNDVEKEYLFVDELAGLERRIRGKGNQERFDYWLNSFRYMKEMGRINCLWGEFNALRDSVRTRAGGDSSTVAQQFLLPRYAGLSAAVDRMLRFLLQTVSTSGEMGTVMNWEEHNLPVVLDQTGEELARMMGRQLPPEARPGMQYEGRPRLIVPCVRTSLSKGENFILRVCLLSQMPPTRGVLRWRPLGTGKYREVPLRHVARRIYRAEMKNPGEDFEYQVVANVGGATLVYPASDGHAGQSVVVEE
jgi:hypothetical protein